MWKQQHGTHQGLRKYMRQDMFGCNLPATAPEQA